MSHVRQHGDATELQKLTEPRNELQTPSRDDAEEVSDEHKASTLDDRPRDSHDSQSGLDEVAAPAPVSHDHEQTGDRLEDRPTEISGDSKIFPLFFQELVLIGYLVFFSFLGTLARLGVQWLTFYPGAPVTTYVLWANLGGSFAMGFLSEDRRLFQHPSFDATPSRDRDLTTSAGKAHHSKAKKTIPLFIGLATGFCGSFTSYSSFMRDAFLALSNDLPSPLSHPLPAGTPSPSFSTTHPRNAGYSVLAVLAVLFYTAALSLGALIVGAHFALLLDRLTPSIPFSFAKHILDPLAIILGFGCWLAAVLITIFPPDIGWRSEVLFALVFAPLGCLARYYASKYLNPLVKSFPVGTFVVNIAGSAVLAMCYDLQRVRVGSAVGGGIAGCGVLQGIMDGFCGCLTTVSTWVSEIKGLRRRHAYVYAVTSVGVGLAVMVLIMGSVRWSVGWSTPVCTTMRTSS